ncbi:hypothetical protein E4U39_002968 [Claviceps sp. Clav50 group G5]|nr:hypothetical protein E4U39_002968 [Claviceps sp. Clav50 group G5]
MSHPSHTSRGSSSPIIALCKRLHLYANVRPVKTIMNVSRPLDMVIVIVCENTTKDLYVKEERTIEGPDGKVAELKPSNEFLKGLLSALPLWLQASLIAVPSSE